MSELSTAREEKRKKDEAFRYARQRCLEATVRSLNSGCSEHFTYEYDRRKSRVSDRRQFKTEDRDTVTPRRRVTFRDVGRRVGDLPWPRLPVAPKPEPVKVVDRRGSTGGRREGARRGFNGPRRTGPTDRRVINTWGAPARRLRRGRRAGDVSYNRLPRASLPKVTPKPSLREAVANLMLPIGREQVLDLLKEYGVEDA